MTKQDGPIVLSRTDEGVEIHDTVVRARHLVRVDGAFDLDPVTPDALEYPIDAAVAIDATTVALPARHVITVQANGEVLDTFDELDHEPYPPGEYVVETSDPVKLYVSVRGGLRFRSYEGDVVLEAGASPVVVGARSYHRSPAATVQTTTDVDDLARAVSTFGSALKTHTPDRSWPTLRGHPPAVAVGEDHSVPTAATPPDRGVTIEVPPDSRSVLAAAPVAYYLGARVRTGRTSRLVAGGFERRLSHRSTDRAEPETGLERLLRRVFVLDCLVRRVGLQGLPSRMHRRYDELVDRGETPALDYEHLFEAAPDDRLRTYHSVPKAVVEELAPEWVRVVDLEVSAAAIESMPYLAADLAVVRPPETPVVSASAATPAVGGFLRRKETIDPADRASDPVTVAADPVGARDGVSLRSGTASGWSRPTPGALERSVDRSPTTGPIEVAVVCNDPAMADELVVADVYDGAESFDVEVHHDLDRADLRALLGRDVELLHYVGHVTNEGIECADGPLDVHDLPPGGVGVETVLVNACRSYDQGLALVERGAVAGVVTLGDVVHEDAFAAGEAFARLLNGGFSLRSARSAVDAVPAVDAEYVVLGDATHAVVGDRVLGRVVLFVDSTDDRRCELTVRHVLGRHGGLGSAYVSDDVLSSLTADVEGEARVLPAEMGPFDAAAADVVSYARVCEPGTPVVVDGDLYWSEAVTESDLGA